MDSTNTKVDILKIQQAKTHNEVCSLRADIHNGLTTDIKSLIATNDNQWKAINENRVDIGIVKDRTE